MRSIESIVEPVRTLIYEYKHIKVPLITYDVVETFREALTKGFRSVEVSLDLGLSKVLAKIEKDEIVVPDLNIRISIHVLENLIDRIRHDDIYAYVPERNELVKLAIYDEEAQHFYKLVYVKRGYAPTIEIDGIHMHRIDINPFDDARNKVRLVKPKNGIVLDTCTGLGYTAINAMRAGAKIVVTVEIDKNVIELSKYNPWSSELENDRIVKVWGDVVRVVSMFEDDVFTHIIHDPPRINVAGELYSKEFYKELFRILRRGGILYHYTGCPGRHSNVSYLKGIKHRLEMVGFRVIRWDEKAMGFIAVKP